MKLFVFGTQGRMSRAIQDMALLDSHIQLLSTPEKNCVLIDFTSPAALKSNLETAQKYQAAYMIGTTGLAPEQFEALSQASTQIPVLWASNTSLGANLLFELTRLASQKLTNFTVSIEDTHHVHKKDSPSGTALVLQESVGRDCKIVSHRTGETAGIHTVLFGGPFETLSLKHEVSDRKVFAQGALLAAQFLSQQKPGLYTMKDVLGFPK
ncbi:MAG: dihydrodipicolinate reductase C-terminal domain-containing protein [Myxococcaceae bacterium]